MTPGSLGTALVLAFVAAGIWWRLSGERVVPGLAILASAVVVVIAIVALTRNRRHRT